MRKQIFASKLHNKLISKNMSICLGRNILPIWLSRLKNVLATTGLANMQ